MRSITRFFGGDSSDGKAHVVGSDALGKSGEGLKYDKELKKWILDGDSSAGREEATPLRPPPGPIGHPGYSSVNNGLSGANIVTAGGRSLPAVGGLRVAGPRSNNGLAPPIPMNRGLPRVEAGASGSAGSLSAMGRIQPELTNPMTHSEETNRQVTTQRGRIRPTPPIGRCSPTMSYDRRPSMTSTVSHFEKPKDGGVSVMDGSRANESRATDQRERLRQPTTLAEEPGVTGDTQKKLDRIKKMRKEFFREAGSRTASVVGSTRGFQGQTPAQSPARTRRRGAMESPTPRAQRADDSDYYEVQNAALADRIEELQIRNDILEIYLKKTIEIRRALPKLITRKMEDLEDLLTEQRVSKPIVSEVAAVSSEVKRSIRNLFADAVKQGISI